MKPVLNVVAGIVWRGNEYLAVERPEGARMAGWWEFPGGKIEAGETRDQALVREFQEELGVTPTDFKYWRRLEHEYDEFVVVLHFFHIRKYSGRLQGLEKQRMAWVDPALPPSLNFLPADIVIVEALHRQSTAGFTGHSRYFPIEGCVEKEYVSNLVLSGPYLDILLKE